MKRKTKREMREIKEYLKELGISLNTYYNIKTGRTKCPKYLKNKLYGENGIL